MTTAIEHTKPAGSENITDSSAGAENIFAGVIYEGDVFRYRIDPGTGLKEIIEHQQEFANIDIQKITGAYAVVLRGGLPPYVEVMTREQVNESLAGSSISNEAVKKIVTGRAEKACFHSSAGSNHTGTGDHTGETCREDTPKSKFNENTVSELFVKHITPDEKKEHEENNNGINWSSPLSIVEGIKRLDDIRSVNEFKKKLKPKLKTFGDRDFILIDNAVTEKENEVLRGF